MMLTNLCHRCSVRTFGVAHSSWRNHFDGATIRDTFAKKLLSICSPTIPLCRNFTSVTITGIVFRNRRLCGYSSLFLDAGHSYRYINSQADGMKLQQAKTVAQTKTVKITQAAQRKLLRKKPQQHQDAHVLKVAIIGAPNAGKSTLANQLLGWRFAAVSKKVHTTRHNAAGVFTEKNTQIIFLDTPGLTTSEKMKRHNLEKTLLTDPYSSLFEADLILAVIDASAIWNRSKLDRDVLTALYLHQERPSILVLNKVDLVKTKLDLLSATRLLTEGFVGGKPGHHFSDKPQSVTSYEDFINKINSEQLAVDSDNANCDNAVENAVTFPSNINTLTDISPSDEKWWSIYQKKLRHARAAVENKRGWDHFDRVFMVSALDGGGVQDIKEYLLESALPGPWHYHSSMITDQDPLELAKMCIWEKLLDHLPDEVPYNIDIKVSMWEIDEDNMLRGVFHLVCTQKRYAVLLLGKDGETIKKIAAEAKQELMNTFKRELTLKLLVITKPKPSIRRK